jgi:molecular chaperone DnaK (HSP70)
MSESESTGKPVVKWSPYVVGIDLGTSNSTAAIFVKGRAQVIPVDGKPMLPSVVRIRDDGDVQVGYPAKNAILIDPENTVASVKREMGNSEYAKEFAALPGKKYTATDIAAEILAKLKAGVEAAGTVDLRGSLRFAVICVPANFEDTKKRATLEAARLAGLEPLYLLEEPVAAAIAYAEGVKRDQKLLVYDLGGGTFDVSILGVDSTGEDKAEFRVLAKEGIAQLGGDDFDYELMRLLATELKTRSGVDVLDLQKDQGISRKVIRQAQQKLKEAAETAKLELSQAETTQVILPDIIKDESGNTHSLEADITRPQFEHAITGLIGQSRTAMEKALAAAKLGIDDISRIIFVGGSTNVPLVRTMVTEMFGKEPYLDPDPATTVARGAAVFGAGLGLPTDKVPETAEKRPEDAPDVAIHIENIVTHFLGIEIADQRFSTILDKGAEIAAEGLGQEKEYGTQRDNQTELRITVYQASVECRNVRDEGCVCIGEFFLVGLPPRPKGQVRVIVRFEINQQNVLKVTARLKNETGPGGELVITRN